MRLKVICSLADKQVKPILDSLISNKAILKNLERKTQNIIYIQLYPMHFSSLKKIMHDIRTLSGIKDIVKINFTPKELALLERKAIFSLVDKPIFSLDKDLNVFSANENFCLIVGLTLEQLLGIFINNVIENFAKQFRKTQKDNPNNLEFNLDVNQKTYTLIYQKIWAKNIKKNETNILGYCFKLTSSEKSKPIKNNLSKANKENAHLYLVAQSASMKKVKAKLKKAAFLSTPLLIYGELGTGKELLAHICHNRGPRSNSKFIHINCSNFSEESLREKIFGTNINNIITNKSAIEEAFCGTLLLAKIDEMPIKLQQELAEFLLTKSMYVASLNKKLTLDVRIICTSNNDLFGLMKKSKFSESLYHYLNVLTINIPSLKKRKDDVLPLAELFLMIICKQLGKPVYILDDKAKDKIKKYIWPGNVRQLKNTIYQAVVNSSCNKITQSDIIIPEYHADFGYYTKFAFEGTLENAVRNYEATILKNLYPSYPSTRALAKKLGTSHTSIANKLRLYKIKKHTNA